MVSHKSVQCSPCSCMAFVLSICVRVCVCFILSVVSRMLLSDLSSGDPELSFTRNTEKRSTFSTSPGVKRMQLTLASGKPPTPQPTQMVSYRMYLVLARIQQTTVARHKSTLFQC